MPSEPEKPKRNCWQRLKALMLKMTLAAALQATLRRLRFAEFESWLSTRFDQVVGALGGLDGISIMLLVIAPIMAWLSADVVIRIERAQERLKLVAISYACSVLSSTTLYYVYAAEAVSHRDYAELWNSQTLRLADYCFAATCASIGACIFSLSKPSGREAFERYAPLVCGFVAFGFAIVGREKLSWTAYVVPLLTAFNLAFLLTELRAHTAVTTHRLLSVLYLYPLLLALRCFLTPEQPELVAAYLSCVLCLKMGLWVVMCEVIGGGTLSSRGNGQERSTDARQGKGFLSGRSPLGDGTEAGTWRLLSLG